MSIMEIDIKSTLFLCGPTLTPSEGSGGAELPPFPTFPSNVPSTLQPEGASSEKPIQPTTGYPTYRPTGTPFSDQPGIAGQGTTFKQAGGFPSTFSPTGTPFQPSDQGSFATGYPGGAPFTSQQGQGTTVKQTGGFPSTFSPTGTPFQPSDQGSFATGYPGGAPFTSQPGGFSINQPTDTTIVPGQPGQESTGYPSSGPSTLQPSTEGQKTTNLGQGTTVFPGRPSTGPQIPLQPTFGQPSTAYPDQPASTTLAQPAELPTSTTPTVEQPSQPPLPEQHENGLKPAEEGGDNLSTSEGLPQRPGTLPTNAPEGPVTSSKPGGESEAVPEGDITEATKRPESEQPVTPTESNVQGGIPKQPGITSELPEQPAVTLPTSAPTSGQDGTEQPSYPASGFTPSIPRGFTTSPSSISTEPESATPITLPSSEAVPEGSEGSPTTVSPESNTIPQVGPQEPVETDVDEHPPHIHAIDVQCGKEMMTINIEFNKEFNGIIYSKGYYNMPECRYVAENSGQIKYTFTVNLNMCGTEFVNAFDTEGQSYLENVLVLQNEAGIQEQWDTVRSVRCLWEGNIKDTLSVAFSIGMLTQEIVTFSGDTAMAKLDVVLGRGPFGTPANGLVKIGENMTLVVSVTGDPGFDIQVKDCKAIDSTGGNSVQLTDENGCILKPKLFGAFQKTKETGNTGASVIAFAHFNAFKFPDIMDLMIECNIELCKTNCDICQKEGESLDPLLRRKRDITNNSLSERVMMGKHLRVVLPEDLKTISQKFEVLDNVCISLHSFVFSFAILISLLVFTSLTCCYFWLKRSSNQRYFK